MWLHLSFFLAGDVERLVLGRIDLQALHAELSRGEYTQERRTERETEKFVECPTTEYIVETSRRKPNREAQLDDTL